MTTFYDFLEYNFVYILRILVAFIPIWFFGIYPLIKRARVRKHIRKNVIPFFKKMQDECDAECPIMMMMIDADSLNMMPYDANKACIFFTDSKFVVKNIFDNTTYVEIPFTDFSHYYRSKISRNYWLFEPKCRNNAEITYTQRLQIASYFP